MASRPAANGLVLGLAASGKGIACRPCCEGDYSAAAAAKGLFSIHAAKGLLPASPGFLVLIAAPPYLSQCSQRTSRWSMP